MESSGAGGRARHSDETAILSHQTAVNYKMHPTFLWSKWILFRFLLLQGLNENWSEAVKNVKIKLCVAASSECM